MEENKKVNELVEASLNPYLILKLVLNHTKEEIEEKLSKVTSDFKMGYEQNALEIETSFNTTFIFMKENYFKRFKESMDSFGFKYKISDATDEIWNMSNEEISIFTKLKNEDPNPEFTKQFFPDMVPQKELINRIITFNFNKKYNIDSVLDKISKDGIDSLNEIHKQILDNGK